MSTFLKFKAIFSIISNKKVNLLSYLFRDSLHYFVDFRSYLPLPKS